MGINNLFKNVGNKIKDVGNKIGGKVTNYVNQKVEKMEQYDQMIQNSKIFDLNKDATIDENNLIEGNWEEYTNICVYIKEEQAKLIDGLIPLNETVLGIVYAIQKKDNKKLIIVLTNLKILVISDNKYNEYNYQYFTSFGVIKKGLMSQEVSINGIILELDINQNDLNIVYNLMYNIQFRNNITFDKRKYLCGIEPVYQKINKIRSGISIDANNIIVFHDKKIKNYLHQYSDLANYELMEDATPVLEKKFPNKRPAIGSIKQECSRISLRITLTNNQIFEIPILEPTPFNSSYNHTNKEYIKYYNFGKEIIEKLESMNPDLKK